MYQSPGVLRRCSLHVGRALVLELSGFSGLVCAVGASLKRFLLGVNFNICEQLSVECCASRIMPRIGIYDEIQ